MQTLANMGQIRSKPVRDVRFSSLYAIVGQHWTNIGQYICATGVKLKLYDRIIKIRLFIREFFVLW